jgi:hypothetical protein
VKPGWVTKVPKILLSNVGLFGLVQRGTAALQAAADYGGPVAASQRAIIRRTRRIEASELID